MQPQPYLLTLLTLFAVLTPQHGVSASLNPAEISSKNETKIVQADVLVKASSRQDKRVAQARRDDSGKAEALFAIAFELISLGKIDQALQVAQTIPDESSKDIVLSEIASKLAASGKIDQALQVAQQIQEESTKDVALSGIASKLAASGKINQALQLAQKIKDEYSTSEPLSRIVGHSLLS